MAKQENFDRILHFFAKKYMWSIQRCVHRSLPHWSSLWAAHSYAMVTEPPQVGSGEPGKQQKEGKDGVCCCHPFHAEQGMGEGNGCLPTTPQCEAASSRRKKLGVRVQDVVGEFRKHVCVRLAFRMRHLTAVWDLAVEAHGVQPYLRISFPCPLVIRGVPTCPRGRSWWACLPTGLCAGTSGCRRGWRGLGRRGR